MKARLALAFAALLAAPLAAQVPLSAQDSFRIGSGGSVLCSATSRTMDPAFADMFDRAYSVVCRDAAVPVGKLYVLRLRAGDPAARLATLRAAEAECAPGPGVSVEGLGPVETLDCRLKGTDIAYRVYLRRSGNALHVAEGLAGYDSALQLALRSLAADRPVEGEVAVATTGAGDPAAFARVQAGQLDPQRALAEAYRRNNAGSYADSSEFFGVLSQSGSGALNQAEAMVNEALQKSNLGRYGEADSLFSRAEALAGADPVTARRLRNYRAIHLLNQGKAEDAMAELGKPMPVLGVDRAVQNLIIDRPTAGRLSAESPGAGRLRGEEGLTQEDKAQILDGQALHLRGTVLRLMGRDMDAVAPFEQALRDLAVIRGGRIAATVWLRAQVHAGLAGIAEARGDRAGAERQHQTGLALLEASYPGSSALLSAKGRIAGFYVRTGRAEQAATLYREIVAATADAGDASPGLRRTLQPYFALLAARGEDPAVVADLFQASQVFVRPGVAQTQAVLARELSGGSDEAARLFRQSVNLTRDIERSRVELARLETSPSPTAATAARMAELRASLAEWQRDQAATQAQLSQYPRYRSVSNGTLALADLQGLLRPGEAYYKMLVVGDELYAVFVTAGSARAFRIEATPAQLEEAVDALRASITVVEDDEQLTYPFDLETSHALYRSLFGPVAAEVAGARHLIFEPDGAMLELPPNLLVMDSASVDTYVARRAANPDDGFDFRGINWLGRERDISTAVSVRAFRDVRNAPPSRARAQYLGFGQNEPARAFYLPSLFGGTRGADAMRPGCSWSLSVWNRPISAKELVTAGNALARGRPGEAEIVTGTQFTDTGIIARDDLADYRILHFATHGLVTAPRPECPPRPALLTSFGGPGSDGLLSFAEIFDLRLDADLVILSACDTAAGAGAAASAEAGLTGTGDYALDGLVRAFVGAGGRMVIASHWPVPDDYDATERLISGLFAAPPGTSTAAALRTAQRALMDERDTSHPYYWSGFAIVGDGAAPVARQSGPVHSASR